MGGYIQSENNLSQEKDRAWIYGEAICCDDARVTKNAALTGHAYVCESRWFAARLKSVIQPA